MDLKEIEGKVRAEHPEFAAVIDKWRGGSEFPILAEEEKKLIWDFVSMAYDFGFMRGMTHGLEQHAKVMDFALGKIFGSPKDSLDKGFKKD